jgi:hypothetical protein
VAALASACDAFEYWREMPAGTLRFELMVETTQSIFGADGSVALPRLVGEGRGRIVAAHFGTYDYTAACSITAAHQHMLHPVCDFAKHVMQVSLAGTGLWLSDGATNVMPIGSREVVHRAWRLHYEHIRHSLITGFYQGWDLHPAQLPTRYAAVYTFFLEGLDAASDRLRNFVQKAAQATLGRRRVRRRRNRAGFAELLPARDELRRDHRRRGRRQERPHARGTALQVVREDSQRSHDCLKEVANGPD